MVFAHDTEEALLSAAALVNTMGGGPQADPDELETLEQLDAFVAHWRVTGSRATDPPAAGRELAAVRALRPRLRRLWTTDDDEELVAGINRLLADGGARPRLVRHDGWDWHLHATEADQPLDVRMAVEAAMALVDVVRSGETARLKVCSADDCDDLHVDLSKNRSRRYCDGGCGNRSNVAAYRARKAAEVG
ncbi:CGNR zinc finger domain-containing protein [Aquipuribacter nitratireducens]|uniref:CGNR zinc finger domain-containing protein n=1 Tax=Aquipuribacter nitratireducens TaxID=650104 RepID=A0ABW0GRN5_9MICO